MNYIRNTFRILSLDTQVYLDLEKNGKLFLTTFMNVLLAGLLFGLANLYHTRILLQEDLAGGFENPYLGVAVFAMLIIASAAQVFLAHAGFSLLLWAIGRGLKGFAPFFSVYLFTGAAMAPLWLGMPFILLYTKGIWNPLSLLLGAFGLAWTAVTITRSIMANQAFSFPKASATFAITVIFIISLRILWS